MQVQCVERAGVGKTSRREERVVLRIGVQLEKAQCRDETLVTDDPAGTDQQCIGDVSWKLSEFGRDHVAQPDRAWLSASSAEASDFDVEALIGSVRNAEVGADLTCTI